ncbi:MAG: hypothetical protein ACRDFQ_06210 [Anaerolineales bacterium]
MLRRLVAAAIGFMGLVYFLQGSGIYTPVPSFMYNDLRWAAAGIALVIVALVMWRSAGKAG